MSLETAALLYVPPTPPGADPVQHTLTVYLERIAAMQAGLRAKYGLDPVTGRAWPVPVPPVPVRGCYRLEGFAVHTRPGCRCQR